MDSGTLSLLESVTLKTLHAQNFSRASSHAVHTLTDVLARYISLIASTCAQYAEHAGRTSVSIRDAVLALDEVGVTMEELTEYAESEGRELARYAGCTSRRAEELAILKETLSEGLRLDQNDAIHLVYSEIPGGEVSDVEEGTSEEESPATIAHVRWGENGPIVNGSGRGERSISPPLPLSPVSNPSSPWRKRARTANWNPPPYIPDFLPPYPTSRPFDSSPTPILSPTIKMESDLTLPPPLTAEGDRGHLPTPPPQPLSTATSTADYLTPVPYNMSSLSSISAAHLPDRSQYENISSYIHSQAVQLQKRRHATLEVTPTLFAAYHHVLKYPPPPQPSTNPSRHRVALAMLVKNYTSPRWMATDTVFSNTAAPGPRVVAPAPTYPLPISPSKGKEEQPVLMPPSASRPVMADETITPLNHQPCSRIPEIARALLPLSVYNRTTRVNPPPPLVNSMTKRKQMFGEGIPAPWNKGIIGPVKGAQEPGDKMKGKGKDGDGDDSEKSKADTLPDALLYATWDWERHDFNEPLPPNRRGRVLGHPLTAAQEAGGGGIIGAVRKPGKIKLEGRLR